MKAEDEGVKVNSIFYPAKIKDDFPCGNFFANLLKEFQVFKWMLILREGCLDIFIPQLSSHELDLNH